MLNIVSLPTFRQERAQVNDLTVHGDYDQTGRFNVKKVRLKDQETEPTDRFWMSLCSRFGIGLPVFNYFTHKEVFDRIKVKSKDANIKITIQDTPAPHQRTLDKWTPQLLGIASNKTGALQGHELIDVLNNLNNASNVDYPQEG